MLAPNGPAAFEYERQDDPSHSGLAVELFRAVNRAARDSRLTM
jgi:hypothetical protein